MPSFIFVLLEHIGGGLQDPVRDVPQSSLGPADRFHSRSPSGDRVTGKCLYAEKKQLVDVVGIGRSEKNPVVSDCKCIILLYLSNKTREMLHGFHVFGHEIQLLMLLCLAI